LEIAWKRVKANHGAGGIDGESIEAFGEGLEERLARLHEELRTDKYIPPEPRQGALHAVHKNPDASGERPRLIRPRR
jgi:hypothetical protein